MALDWSKIGAVAQEPLRLPATTCAATARRATHLHCWPVCVLFVVVGVAGFEPTTSSPRTTSPASLSELMALGKGSLRRLEVPEALDRCS
jgi:hypothetical protein